MSHESPYTYVGMPFILQYNHISAYSASITKSAPLRKSKFSFSNYSSIFRLMNKTKQFIHMSGKCERVSPANAFTRIYGSENNNSIQCSTALRAAVESIIRTGSARTNSQYGKPNWLWTATIPAPMQIGYINRYMALLCDGWAYASFARCGGSAALTAEEAVWWRSADVHANVGFMLKDIQMNVRGVSG